MTARNQILNKIFLFIAAAMLLSSCNNMGASGASSQEPINSAKSSLKSKFIDNPDSDNLLRCLSGEVKETHHECLVSTMRYEDCMRTELTIKNNCDRAIGLAKVNVFFSFFYKNGQPLEYQSYPWGYSTLSMTYEINQHGKFVGEFAGTKPLIAAYSTATFSVAKSRIGTTANYDTDLANKTLKFVSQGPSFKFVESLPAERATSMNSFHNVPVDIAFGLYSTMITNFSALDMESGFVTSELLAPFEYYDFNKEKDCRFKALKSGESCYLIMKYAPTKIEHGDVSITISSSVAGFNYESNISTQFSSRYKPH